MKKIVLFLLSPISLLYGLIVGVYQGFYLSGILRPNQFNIPVIAIGNLTVGGTGKSPHVEYLIQLLKDYVNLGVISRGYLRKTRGHYLVDVHSRVEEVGDEPLQLKRNFPEIPVAVNENRSFGIPLLIKSNPQLQLIIMDDAFQHLQVKAGLNILLTEYSNLYVDDFLLPGGRLREWRYGANRADIIIVTKCPDHLNENLQDRVREKLKPNIHQKLFFSKIKYGVPYSHRSRDKRYFLNPSLSVVLISAIAQSSYLVQELSGQCSRVKEYRFEDHHYFKDSEIVEVIRYYQSVEQSNKMILTTEKDAVRLERYYSLFEKEGIELWIIPIEIEIFQKAEFDSLIKEFLLNFKV